MDNSLLLDALRCKKTPRPPIWLMRQAGRYMKEYRDLKEKYTFLELCRNPELATRITLMPIDKFGFDAAIMFADILLILQTLDFEIGFGTGHGPFINTKDYLKQVDQIPLMSVKDTLSYIPQTIRSLKKELTVPLIGFCGAPFTLATYLLEGKTSRTFEETKKWIYNQPNQLHFLLKILTKQSIEYLKMQIDAGVDAVQIFDSWAGFFSEPILKEFCFPYLGEIVQALKPYDIPIILFAKGSCLHAEELAALNPSAISLDESANLKKISKKISSKIALQGNLDPDLLIAPIKTLKEQVEQLCRSMHNRPGFIMNLGHGIKPHCQEENVRCMVETVKNMSY
ncbi:MAG: Uroporphyrinogen decarboxylase [Chlamydiae bacterium]|nr:Uroporphyrinogen decarboxylase [Chlamydiota bacterium]